MATTYVAIATTTVGSGGAASMTFSSIPATYTDLVVKISARTSDTQDNGNVGMNMKINAATTGYTGRVLYGYGSDKGSYQSNSQSIGSIISGGSAVNSMFSNHEVYIPNYAGSTAKSYSVDVASPIDSTTLSEVDLIAKGQSSTSAITDLTLTCASGNFVQYSSATLYGIKNS